VIRIAAFSSVSLPHYKQKEAYSSVRRWQGCFKTR